jgi:hypothetical protein
MDANKIKMKSKTVSNLGFKGSDDGELIELAKEYARLRPGLSLKAAIRNYLLIALPKEIERIRNNGEQLTA